MPVSHHGKFISGLSVAKTHSGHEQRDEPISRSELSVPVPHHENFISGLSVAKSWDARFRARQQLMGMEGGRDLARLEDQQGDPCAEPPEFDP